MERLAAMTAHNLSRLLQKIDAEKTERVITSITKNFVPMIFAKTVPDVKGRSSSEYVIGNKVVESYHQKASSAPVSLSIRGMIIGVQDDIQATIQQISSVFEKIVFSNDFLRYYDYEVDSNLAYDWLVNNEIAGEAAIQTLKNNQNMWSNPSWGVGRDLVPFLCLTTDELPVFVSLPTDPELPIFFKRKKIRNTNYGGMVFPLGNIS
jgi:hypothetical protein